MNEQGSQQADVVIVGAGAAGLATAIHAGEILPGRRIVILEGARQVGAKILVSGGGRCNVTNRVVTADDYRGSSRAAIGRVLARFNVENTFDWFKAMGVELYEEELGKLFPDSNSARTIVEELVRTARHRGVNICTGQRVLQIDKQEHSFVIRTATGEWIAPQVVLACGGQSLPRSGSDGWGYRVVQHFGHSIVPPVPALVPFMLDGEIHATLRGISQPAEGRVWVEGSPVWRETGSMLWTHFGVSGPLVLDASGIWTRARSENKSAEVFFNFWPGCSEETVLAAMQSLSTSHPRGQVGNSLAQLNRLLGVEPFAERFVVQVLSLLQQDGTVTLAHWPREARQLLIRQLMLWRLPVRETRGYNYAEVTAGGVPLREVEIATMQSRCCPGLFLVGEILDVDGRIGGFNFQWAWSSGYVAAQGLAQL